MRSEQRLKYIRMLLFFGALVVSAAPAAAVDANCAGASGGSGRILAIEAFDQTWCWEALPGSPVYRVETKAFRRPWIEEAVVTENKVTLRREIGDSTRVRVRACWGSSCSEPSRPSRRVVVLPDFDMDNDHFITASDFAQLRSSLGGNFALFRAAFGKVVQNEQYVRWD